MHGIYGTIDACQTRSQFKFPDLLPSRATSAEAFIDGQRTSAGSSVQRPTAGGGALERLLRPGQSVNSLQQPLQHSGWQPNSSQSIATAAPLQSQTAQHQGFQSFRQPGNAAYTQSHPTASRLQQPVQTPQASIESLLSQTALQPPPMQSQAAENAQLLLQRWSQPSSSPQSPPNLTQRPAVQAGAAVLPASAAQRPGESQSSLACRTSSMAKLTMPENLQGLF